MNDFRTLLYNCCDDDYTHYIPFFCASALFSCKNIDIEIGINLDSLSEKEETALDRLRKLHPEARLLIKYNFYQKTKRSGFDNCIYNDMKMWSNSVRFISEPEIRNKYTYISDIDMMIMMKDFYNYHIGIMAEYGTIYSNWKRDNDQNAITGLHFVQTDKWYPIILDNLKTNIIDEHLLMNITKKKTEINERIPRRPACGLHFSHGQNLKVQLTLSKKYVNELKSYKQSFFDFLESEEYNCIKDTNTQFISNYVEDFKKYYNSI